jgi:hypothetical protein
MSNSRSDEVKKHFVQLWRGDSNQWNHDQRMVAAGVYELFLETTTITDSDLRMRIDKLITARPEAYSVEVNGKTPTGSRSAPKPRHLTRLWRMLLLTVCRTVTSPLNRMPEDETAAPSVPSKTKRSANEKLRMRISRLRDRILWNIRHLARGEAPDPYEVNPEFFGMEEPFGSAYDRLARIHDHQLLLHTKLAELDDATSKSQIMDEASRWVLGTSPEDEEEMLSEIQHALKSLERDPSVTERTAMTGPQAASRIRSFRVLLGENNVKASKGIKLKHFGRTVDLHGRRANVFHDLLGSLNRQFAIARMLTELDSQDVKDSYQAFTEKNADGWTKSKRKDETCITYEEGLRRQEELVSNALEREMQHNATTQPIESLGRPQIAGEPSRSSLSSATLDQTLQDERARATTGSVTLPQAPPTYTTGVSKQPEGSPGVPESQNGDTGLKAHERIHALTLSNTSFLESHRRSDESPKLIVRLDPAGARGRAMSRHLRWSPNDTRTAFLDKVAKLFPGKAVQQVNARLPGRQVTIQPYGPEEEWGIVREEWLERLQQPLKKEPSAAVYLAEVTE